MIQIYMYIYFHCFFHLSKLWPTQDSDAYIHLEWVPPERGPGGVWWALAGPLKPGGGRVNLAPGHPHISSRPLRRTAFGTLDGGKSENQIYYRKRVGSKSEMVGQGLYFPTLLIYWYLEFNAWAWLIQNGGLHLAHRPLAACALSAPGLLIYWLTVNVDHCTFIQSQQKDYTQTVSRYTAYTVKTK